MNQKGTVMCGDPTQIKKNGNIKPLGNDIANEDQLCCSPIFASIFSMKIPYPLVGSLMRTCVTAPMSLPS